ncbi:hypothetical protein FIBSPDRAFT_854446 [Athelia psychrophila]|uniref:Uncharacterized protein n=1 Tax=Athelia psychrophila TaxID=1759441 RepID=A0A166Q588_9AGAM|nr:hypothetical protein FIBSPDRAFT_854446 [Fibularhizoctonia sp. CBS 109695]
MPSLSELEIRECATFALTRSVLRRMTYRHDKGSSPLVPKLQALKIDWRKPAFHDEAFANMVASRWAFNGSPERNTLQIVELDIIPPDEEEEDEDCFEDSLLDGDVFDPVMIRDTLRILRRCKTDGMKAKVIEEDDDWYPTDWLTV